jgi:hypothetical protein
VIVRRRDRNDLVNQLGGSGKVVASEEAFPFESRQHVLNKEVLLAVPSAAAPSPATPSAALEGQH